MMGKEVPFRKIPAITDRLHPFKREKGWDEKRKLGKLEEQTKAPENQAFNMFCFARVPEPFINATKLGWQWYNQRFSLLHLRFFTVLRLAILRILSLSYRTHVTNYAVTIMVYC